MRASLLILVLLPSACSLPVHPRYLALDGRPEFLLGGDPTAKDLAGFIRHFDAAAAAGERIARIHLHHGLPRAEGPAGSLDEDWCRRWDEVLDAAEARGLRVLPVMTGWAQWNDGSRGSRWHNWDRNPYNVARGGPAATPADLYADTPCRRLFLDWLGRAVDRFQGHRGIFAWEIFTELNLLSGGSEAAAIDFVERAADVIRRHDPAKRPVTASLAGVKVWPELWSSPAVDIIQVHPYPGPRRGDDLARAIAEIAPIVQAFGKPVLIGESGLDPGPPEDTADARPRAFVAYRQAVWTALTAGFANGGMIWWISGYGKGALDGASPGLCKAAAAFARDLDVTRMQPLKAAAEGVIATALGDAATMIVYVRDPRCVAPDWPSRELRGIALKTDRRGRARFLDPATLGDLGSAPVEGGVIALPPFREDLLVRID